MAGHPVLEIELPTPLALGAEFYRWEFATAVAGASLGINPFDEPNVTEAKEATARAIKALGKRAACPTRDRSCATADRGWRPDCWRTCRRPARATTLALCRVFPADPRARIACCRRSGGSAVTAGTWPPRWATGRAFCTPPGNCTRVGPNTGVFLQLTGRRRPDLQVPERGFSFGVLRDAQALGDLEALRQHRRRVARVDLGQDIEAGLERLLAALTHRAPRLSMGIRRCAFASRGDSPLQNGSLTLAGDIGGTNCRLALFRGSGEGLRAQLPVAAADRAGRGGGALPGRGAQGAGARYPPAAGLFRRGRPGGGRHVARSPTCPGSSTPAKLEQRLKIPRVALLNDFQAAALGVTVLATRTWCRWAAARATRPAPAWSPGRAPAWARRSWSGHRARTATR